VKEDSDLVTAELTMDRELHHTPPELKKTTPRE
jgi:hypothetical protein